MRTYQSDLHRGLRDDIANFYEFLNLKTHESCADTIRDAIASRNGEIAKLPPDDPDREASASQLDLAVHTLCDAQRKQSYDVALRRALLLKPVHRPQQAAAETQGALPETAATSKREPVLASGTDPRPVISERAPCAADLTLDDDFELLDVAGEGESTTVYRAYDRRLRRYVAVKQLNTPVGDPRAAELFWSQAEFVAGLGDDHMVRVFGVDKNKHWVITEWMESDLSKVSRRGPSSPDLVRSVLQQALRGLQALHGREVLHGQIKPSNLLVTGTGKVKLSETPGFPYDCEFHLPAHTCRHVAPELLRPEAFGPVGPGTDLYQLGFVAIEMLLGDQLGEKLRCMATDVQQVPMAWLRWHGSTSEMLPDIDELIPGLPDDVRLVVQGLTRKQVSERFQTAEAALESLVDRPLRCIELKKSSSDAPLPAVDALKDFLPTAVAVETRSPRSKRRYLYFGLASVAAMLLFVAAAGSESGDDPMKSQCQLAIQTEPPGARIIIDGQAAGTLTPGLVAVLPGEHEVQLDLEGYETLIDTVVVSQGRESLQAEYRLQSVARKASQVTINSDPPDAIIWIDGVGTKWLTNSTIELPLGHYALELRREGYEIYSSELVVNDSVEVCEARLKPNTLHLEVLSDPPGALVEINGKSWEKVTPCQIPVQLGKYQVVTSLDGYRTEKREVVVSDADVRVTMELLKQVATVPVTFTSNPSGAEVLIDGRRQQGRTPLTVDLLPGTYEIQLSHDGYKLESASQTIGNFPTTVSLTMEPVRRRPSASGISPELLEELKRAWEPRPIEIVGPGLTPESRKKVSALIRQSLRDNWASRASRDLDLRPLVEASRIAPNDPRVALAAGLACEHHYHRKRALAFYTHQPQQYSALNTVLFRRLIYMSVLSSEVTEAQQAPSLCADLMEMIPPAANKDDTTRQLMLLNIQFAAEMAAYFELVHETAPSGWSYSESEGRIRRALDYWPEFNALYDHLKREAIVALRDRCVGEFGNPCQGTPEDGLWYTGTSRNPKRVMVFDTSYRRGSDSEYGMDSQHQSYHNAPSDPLPQPYDRPTASRRDYRCAFVKLFEQNTTMARTYLLKTLPNDDECELQRDFDQRQTGTSEG